MVYFLPLVIHSRSATHTRAHADWLCRNRIMYREAPTESHVREPPSAAYIIYARAHIEAL